MRRSVWLVTVVLLVASCGSSGAPKPSARSTSTSSSSTSSSTTTSSTPAASTTARPTTTAAPATTARPDPCAVRPQGAPPASVAADFATAIAFAPDGRLFFAERAGTVRVVQDGATRTFATVPTLTAEPGGGYSERGLLGLAISPTFARDRFVYAVYSDRDHAHQDLIRWTDCAGAGTAAKVLLQWPSGSDCCHKGGRIAFGPDGKLYVTLGDEHSARTAQDTSDPRGKVLRYNPDGSVPGDNPFGPGNPVWAFGFRNPFGIAIAANGQLAITNNGPTGDAGAPSTGYDTVVASVARGGGYQWPNCYGYSHPIGGASCGNGQHEPDWSSETTTVVPTGAAFIGGHLVFCTLSGGMKILTPGSPHATLTNGSPSCKLDVKQGPDGATYVSDTSRIVRV